MFIPKTLSTLVSHCSCWCGAVAFAEALVCCLHQGAVNVHVSLKRRKHELNGAVSVRKPVTKLKDLKMEMIGLVSGQAKCSLMLFRMLHQNKLAKCL